MKKKIFIILSLLSLSFSFVSSNINANPTTDYTPPVEPEVEDVDEFQTEQFNKCEKASDGTWNEECTKMSRVIYKYKRSVIYEWISNSYDGLDETEVEALKKTEELTSYYKFYITGNAVVETYQLLDLEGTDKIVEIGYFTAVTINKLLLMLSFMFVIIALSFASLVYEDTVTDIFYNLFKYINETVFNFQDPTSFGWLILVIMMLLILGYKIVDSLKNEKISIKEIVRWFLKVFVTGIIITYSFTTITPNLITFRNQVHSDAISYLNDGSTSEKSMNQKSMLFDMLSLNPFIIKNFGFEDYDTLKEDTKNKIDNQIKEGIIVQDDLIEIYGTDAINENEKIDYNFITDCRIIGVAANYGKYLYYEYDEITKSKFDEKGSVENFSYENTVIPGDGATPYWELGGFQLIMLIHTILLSCIVIIIVLMAQLTTIVELAVYSFIFILLAKLMWVDGKGQVLKEIRARISFFIVCLVLAVFYELLMIGLNALTIKAVKEGFIALLVSDTILIILLVMLWKFKTVILKALVRKVIPAFFNGESVIKRIQDNGGVKNIAKANVEKLKTNVSDSTKSQNKMVKDLEKTDMNKALLYDSYLNDRNIKKGQKKKIKNQLREELRANHTVDLSKVDDVEKLEALTKNIFKRDSQFILDHASTMDKEKKKDFLKQKISDKTKRKVFYDSEFNVPKSKGTNNTTVNEARPEGNTEKDNTIKSSKNKVPKIAKDTIIMNDKKQVELARKNNAKDRLLGKRENEKDI